MIATARPYAGPPVLHLPLTLSAMGSTCWERQRLSGCLPHGLLPTVSVPGSESEGVVLAFHANMWPLLMNWITHTADRYQSWRTGPDNFPIYWHPVPRVPTLRKVAAIHQEKLCSLFIFTFDKTCFAGLPSLSLDRRGQGQSFLNFLAWVRTSNIDLLDTDSSYTFWQGYKNHYECI